MHPRATPALLRLLADPMEDVRYAAMDALTAMRAEAAVPLFVALARRRPSDDPARRAQVALGKIGSPAAIAALVALTRTPPVSAESKAALRLAGTAAVPALVRELLPAHRAAARSRPPRSGDIGDRRATAPLGEALERHAELAPVGLDALARIGDPAAVPTLVRAAESPDLETRRRGYAALLAVRDGRAIVALQRGFADADPYVRELSVTLAAAIGAQASAVTAAALLGDSEREVRRAAAAALPALAAPSAALVSAVIAAIVRAGRAGP